MAQTLSERADSARDQLFQRYDQLNALWTQAEEQLTKLHIPTGVQFNYRSWDAGDQWQPAGYDRHLCLGLQKLGGKWRICHGSADDLHEPDVENWTPITECSASIRVDAARYLPKLREAVIKSAEDFIPRVDKAIADLQAALNTDMGELIAERAKLNGKAK